MLGGAGLVAELYEPANVPGGIDVQGFPHVYTEDGGAANDWFLRSAVVRLRVEGRLERSYEYFADRGAIAFLTINSVDATWGSVPALALPAGPAFALRTPTARTDRLLSPDVGFGMWDDSEFGYAGARSRTRLHADVDPLPSFTWSRGRAAALPDTRDLVILTCGTDAGAANEPWTLSDWRSVLLEDALDTASLSAGDEEPQAVRAVNRLVAMAPLAAAVDVDRFPSAIAAIEPRLDGLLPVTSFLMTRGEAADLLGSATKLFERDAEFSRLDVRRLLDVSESDDACTELLSRVARDNRGTPLGESLRRTLRERSRESAAGDVPAASDPSAGDGADRDGGAGNSDPPSEGPRTAMAALVAYTVLGLVAVTVAAARTLARRNVPAFVTAVATSVCLGVGAWVSEPVAGESGWRPPAVLLAAVLALFLRRRLAALLLAYGFVASLGLPSHSAIRHVLPHALVFAGVVALLPWRSAPTNSAGIAPQRARTRPRVGALVCVAVALLPWTRFFPWAGLAPRDIVPLELGPYTHRFLGVPWSTTTALLQGAAGRMSAVARELTDGLAFSLAVLTFVSVFWALFAPRAASPGPLARVLVVWLTAFHVAALWCALVPVNGAHRLADFATAGAVGAAVLVGLASAAAALHRFSGGEPRALPRPAQSSS